MSLENMPECGKQCIYAVFDMGGTVIKASLMNDSGKIVEDTFGTYPACSYQTDVILLNRVVEILLQMLERCPGCRLKGIGFSFPGPFDYEHGISYMKGLNKYDSLYGINVRKEILRRINGRVSASDKENDLMLLFENDAALFALGECNENKILQNSSVLCLTLGTGVGSAFIRNGRLLREGKDIPEHGWIYCCPYNGGCVEDYLSRRRIIELAVKYHMSIDEPIDLYYMAVQGSRTAWKIWEEFGTKAGEILNPYMERFGGRYLVLGGQISKAAQFFMDSLKKAIGSKYIVCTASRQSAESIFHGMYQLFTQGR